MSREREGGKERWLHGFGTDKGEKGVQNPENLADVICDGPLNSFTRLKPRYS